GLIRRGPTRFGLPADEPAEACLHRHGSTGRSSDSTSHKFIVIVDADQDIDQQRRTRPLLQLGFGQGPVGGPERCRPDFPTNLRNHKRLYQGTCLGLARASFSTKPEFYSPPFTFRPHSTAKSCEATALVGSREPEDLGEILPDEGDFGPRVEETVYHHVVSVRSVSASADGLETPPRGASSGQKALVGLVGPRWLRMFPRRRRVQELVVWLATSVHSARTPRSAFSRPMASP
ncbi:conserved hypothetical protein, partial [Trichinella spiralis]|uniref:hypothetical protein n=1 Tax=Trichinella spiralis TaxID=6334 RepID=UPI0001EFDC46